MFRLSQFIREITSPTPVGPRRQSAPVVIWNLIRRCNLACRHCYSASSDKDFAGELDLARIRTVMADLKAFKVPAVILSGGEPLLRPDIWEIAACGRELGLNLSLSTNGTLIDAAIAKTIAAAGFAYVGISLDGTGAVHDRFRGKDGAFAASLEGVRHCKAEGLKVGLRFTLTRDNAAELPAVLRLLDDEGLSKFYFSHLNYAGRGHRNRGEDADSRLTREANELLFDTAWKAEQDGRPHDFVTGNNDADGPFFLAWVRRHVPAAAPHIEAKLRQWGGNASGVNVANIDNQGAVHPDTMWWHETLGNVKDRPFSAIWSDRSGELMAGLAAHPRRLKGRCADCRWLTICNGNSRVRAERQLGDRWGEDPGCYLTDTEISAREVCAA